MDTKMYTHPRMQLSEDEIMSETTSFKMTVNLDTIASLRARYGDHSEQELFRLAAAEVTGEDTSVDEPGGYIASHAKLTPEQWAQLFAEWRAGASYAELSEKYGVTPGRISQKNPDRQTRK